LTGRRRGLPGGPTRATGRVLEPDRGRGCGKGLQHRRRSLSAPVVDPGDPHRDARGNRDPLAGVSAPCRADPWPRNDTAAAGGPQLLPVGGELDADV